MVYMEKTINTLSENLSNEVVGTETLNKGVTMINKVELEKTMSKLEDLQKLMEDNSVQIHEGMMKEMKRIERFVQFSGIKSRNSIPTKRSKVPEDQYESLIVGSIQNGINTGEQISQNTGISVIKVQNVTETINWHRINP